jgi:hypothetical protein
LRIQDLSRRQIRRRFSRQIAEPTDILDSQQIITARDAVRDGEGRVAFVNKEQVGPPLVRGGVQAALPDFEPVEACGCLIISAGWAVVEMERRLPVTLV